MSLLTAPVPKVLMDELDKRFPVKSVTPDDTFNEVLFEAGKRHVVEFIKASYEAQQRPETAFKTKIR